MNDDSKLRPRRPGVFRVLPPPPGSRGRIVDRIREGLRRRVRAKGREPHWYGMSRDLARWVTTSGALVSVLGAMALLKASDGAAFDVAMLLLVSIVGLTLSLVGGAMLRRRPGRLVYSRSKETHGAQPSVSQSWGYAFFRSPSARSMASPVVAQATRSGIRTVPGVS
jgi:hypothetical protein